MKIQAARMISTNPIELPVMLGGEVLVILFELLEKFFGLSMGPYFVANGEEEGTYGGSEGRLCIPNQSRQFIAKMIRLNIAEFMGFLVSQDPLLEGNTGGENVDLAEEFFGKGCTMEVLNEFVTNLKIQAYTWSDYRTDGGLDLHITDEGV